MIKVNSLRMAGFFSHADTALTFPIKGLVLVTGPNGSGKSSIVEAVSVGFWNKTLRGTKPWAGNESRLEVEAEEAQVIRERVGTKQEVRWSARGASSVYENATKANAALQAVVGDWDQWRRSCVLSALDVESFTRAKDSERKRFLEALVGLSVFDAAYEHAHTKCRIALEDEMRAKQHLEVLKNTREMLSRQHEQAKQALASWRNEPTTSPSEEYPSQEHVQTLARATEQAFVKLQQCRKDIDQIHDYTRRLEREVHSITLVLQSAKANGRCVTCRQKVNALVTHGFEQSLAEAEDKLAEWRSASAEPLHQATTELDEAMLAHSESTRAHSEASRAYQLSSSQTALYSRLVQQRDHARTELEKVEAALLGAETTLVECMRQSRLHTAACKVLGTRGFRSLALGKVVAVLEQVANAWLGKLSTPMRIGFSVRPWGTKGEEVLDINVVGLGHSEGYEGSSGGERRKLDVALAMGFFMLVSGKRKTESTFFVDEVFDSLDDDGLEAVVKVLEESARNQTIVVITHNKFLRERLASSACARWSFGEPT